MNVNHPKQIQFLSFLIIFLIILVISTPVFGHGPKGHKQGNITALAAAQQGMKLYDKLISSGKLDEPWETEFISMEVSQKMVNKKHEFTIKFSREKGDPKSVYIFISGTGEYIGSNFSGK